MSWLAKRVETNIITIPISRKAQYKDVFRRTIETPQRARIFKANSYLKVQNAHLKVTIGLSVRKRIASRTSRHGSLFKVGKNVRNSISRLSL